MPGTCAFCRRTGTLTGEHVFGDWLGKIGLNLDPLPHGAGWLNRIERDLGVRPPFRQTVRDVCGDCNHGWMSRLEVIAQRALTPCILGEPAEIAATDVGGVATWAQKTALTAMLVSSIEDRGRGYGLPASEYHELYALRDDVRPLPASQFWIGQYEGVRRGSAWVTPLAVHIDGLPEPDRPHGYAMTIVLGRLAIHGARFTTPSIQVELTTVLDFPQLWPPAGTITWPSEEVLDDDAFLSLAGGKDFRTTETNLEVRPWRPATELATSQTAHGTVVLPTICGKHFVCYPTVLVDEAYRGRFYAFEAACECPVAYLIRTEPDGAHFKAAATPEIISELYEKLLGEEYVFEDQFGRFVCKSLSDESGEEQARDDAS